MPRTGTWEDSKSKQLHDHFRVLFGESGPTTKEKQALMVQEMIFDTTLAMASGGLGGWYNLADTFDPERGFDQDAEFQHSLSVVIASNIGLALTLHAAKVSSIEFMVGRTVTLRPITRVLTNPLIAAPALMLMTTAEWPTVAGPQYQSAITGQPSIGSTVLDKPAADSWSDLFSLEYWRGY